VIRSEVLVFGAILEHVVGRGSEPVWRRIVFSTQPPIRLQRMKTCWRR
jgi:hypothetical protein